MWLLLAACTPPPPPSIALPAMPAAAAAESVNVDRFLVATPLGAKDAMLCPWFRGEAVPDASLARWTAEDRLVWLVLEAGPAGPTLAGGDVATVARATREAATKLAETCGGTRAADVLVALGADAKRSSVDSALTTLAAAGFASAWVAVAGAGGGGGTGSEPSCVTMIGAPDEPWSAAVARIGAGGGPASGGPVNIPLHGQLAAVAVRTAACAPPPPAPATDGAAPMTDAAAPETPAAPAAP
jgi:hypothetical protein